MTVYRRGRQIPGPSPSSLPINRTSPILPETGLLSAENEQESGALDGATRAQLRVKVRQGLGNRIS